MILELESETRMVPSTLVLRFVAFWSGLLFHGPGVQESSLRVGGEERFVVGQDPSKELLKKFPRKLIKKIPRWSPSLSKCTNPKCAKMCLDLQILCHGEEKVILIPH